jgi:hypothetical protein
MANSESRRNLGVCFIPGKKIAMILGLGEVTVPCMEAIARASKARKKWLSHADFCSACNERASRRL